MKMTFAAVVACALLGGVSVACAQTSGAAGTGMTKHHMKSGRASATESKSNNQPGTTAGTPVHSVPQNGLPGNANSSQDGK